MWSSKFPSLDTFWQIAILALLLSRCNSCSGQETLSATYLEAKLPSPSYCHSPFYDGGDSIYLLGSCTSPSNQIMVFSISSATLNMVGSLPDDAAMGSVHGDDFGNIFFFGGIYSKTKVYRYNPASNGSWTVATLPMSVDGHTSFKVNSTTVYMLGGFGGQDKLLTFDMETLESSIVTSFPFSFYAGTSVRVGNEAFIFDDADSFNFVFQLDLETLEMSQVGPNTLPRFLHYPTSVWDSHFVYVLGGHSDSHRRKDGLYQFDTTSYQHTFIPVSNLPVGNSTYYFHAPKCVYIPSRNRIYCFGGQTGEGSSWTTLDSIFYIDMSPLQPPTTTMPTTTRGPSTTPNPELFNCVNRPDGMYPYPTDCSKFISCLDEVMSVFDCPPPLLFDPVLLTCNLPNLVNCDLSCVNRPDGFYPHPTDCGSFIICQGGVTNVFPCPPPLLFDPETLTCKDPSQVTC